MAVEIERKFLVLVDRWQAVEKPEPTLYSQGYLFADDQKTVRVRIGNGQGYLTVKGANAGISRLEFEYAVPLADAERMIAEFCGDTVTKQRYVLHHAGKRWEVDEFLAENEGLLVAEIELRSEDEPFERPDWLGEEVSHDPRYANASLARHPYQRWKDDSMTS